MQNKKSLLQRLLVIYITFFIVLVASIAHGILPNFSRGAAEGAELGNDIAEKWKSGVPRMIYMLGDIRVTGQPETAVEIAAAPGVEIKANVRKLALVVEQNAPGTSPLGLAFRSIGGSAWLYALVMLCPLLYLAIIVLMFVIIHSLRRSIREERTLDKRNVWYLRAIGMLTIVTELISDTVDWVMNSRTARRKRIHRRRGFPRLLRNDHHGYPDPFRRRGLRHRPEFERGAETDHLKQTT